MVPNTSGVYSWASWDTSRGQHHAFTKIKTANQLLICVNCYAYTYCLWIFFFLYIYPSKQHLLNRPTAIFLSFQLTVSCRSNTSLVTVSSFCWNFWFSWELRLIKHRRKKKRKENRHNKAVMRRNIWRKKTGGSLWRRVIDIENLNLPISSMKDIKNNTFPQKESKSSITWLFRKSFETLSLMQILFFLILST